MKSLLILPLLLFAACNPIQEMTDLVQESTCSIEANSDMIERSTAIIQENGRQIEASTRVMNENRELLYKNR